MAKKEAVKIDAPPNNIRFEDEFIIPDDAPDDIVVETMSTKDGVSNTKYVVHVMVCESKTKPGSTIHYRPYYYFDYYGHLKKYGKHWHEFSRPGNKIEKGLFKLSEETIFSTPELWPALITLQKFMKKVRTIISQMNES